MEIIYTLGVILGLWLYLVVWFFAVGTYLRLKRANQLKDVPTFIYYSLYAVLVPGLVVDVLFNLTYGTLHYKQLPKDLLFSNSTARIIREGAQLSRWGQPDQIYKRAERWKTILNKIDPNHI